VFSQPYGAGQPSAGVAAYLPQLLSGVDRQLAPNPVIYAAAEPPAAAAPPGIFCSSGGLPDKVPQKLKQFADIVYRFFSQLILFRYFGVVLWRIDFVVRIQ